MKRARSRKDGGEKDDKASGGEKNEDRQPENPRLFYSPGFAQDVELPA